MYDIKPLEEEWKKYNKKRRRPWYIIAIAASLLIVSSLIFIKYNIGDLFKSENTNIVKSVENIKVKKSNLLLINKPLVKLEENKNQDEEKENKHIASITEVQPKTIVAYDNNPMDDESVTVESSKKIKKPQIREKVKVIPKKRKKMHLNIIKTTSVSAYKDVEKRFYESHDTDDSLFLAKSYYNKGNYDKAEYWALQTNKINAKIDESWLIFAKSKVKLGHKNEAIQLLMSYIKRTNSFRAKGLLSTIKKGM